MNLIKSFANLVFGSTDRLTVIDPDGVLNPTLTTSLYGSTAQYNDTYLELKKINEVFSSPALLKVICLQCDLFSLGKAYVYQDGKDIGSDPALDRLNNPNPFQGRSQILWDYMFWLMVGNAYCYLTSNVVTNDTAKIYFLDTSKMQFPDWLLKQSDKLVLSASAEKEINRSVIKYKYSDGSSVDINYSDLMMFSDLTNGVGSWFKGPSRISALHKIICNSEHTLDVTNINIRYTGKFIVAGTTDPNDVTKTPMGEDEKKDIETKMNSRRKQVYGMKSMIEIKRFVENLANLKLPEMYASQYYFIGNMYGIPKDILEAYAQTGATFENQEKAVGRHVAYTMQPKADDFTGKIGARWGYDKQGKEIVISWDHLPFMQVFEKDRSLVQSQKVQTLTALLKLGVSLQEANEFLDLNFSNAKYENPKVNPGGN